MARPKGASGPRTLAAIKATGRDLIYRHGYEAMNLRQLARRVGIKQGSLYNHIRSKQDLLFRLMHEHLEDLIRGLDRTLSTLSDPLERLQAFTRFHVLRHMEKRDEVYINNSELRSLTPANRRKIVALRDVYDRRVMAILAAGCRAGILNVQDVKVSTFVLIAALTGVCNWYKPDGRLTPQELVELHTSIAINGLLSRASRR